MTIRTKVQASATDRGLWPRDLEVAVTARFMELVSGPEIDVTQDEIRNAYAQVFWEFFEDGRITAGDLCYVAGLALAGYVFENEKAEMFEGALTHAMANGDVDA